MEFPTCSGASDGAASRERDASGGRAVDEAGANLDASAVAASLLLLLVPA